MQCGLMVPSLDVTMIPNSNRNAPLGVFDSGVGGLTVVKALRKLLPHESIVYLGDTARIPYGSKSPDTIRQFSMEDTQFLIGKGVKAVVVACNTATAHALPLLQATFKVPIIGVLEPGVEAVLADKNCSRVGIIGTEGTIRSHAYQHMLAMRRPELRTHAIATPLLVPFVEAGWLTHDSLRLVLEEYLGPLMKKEIDTLVLGCTHYPLLMPILRKILGKSVRLVDSAATCAHHVGVMLKEHDLMSQSQRAAGVEIYLTDVSERAEELTKRFLGETIKKIQRARLS
jgi:glutamate racemase